MPVTSIASMLPVAAASLWLLLSTAWPQVLASAASEATLVDAGNFARRECEDGLDQCTPAEVVSEIESADTSWSLLQSGTTRPKGSRHKDAARAAMLSADGARRSKSGFSMAGTAARSWTTDGEKAEKQARAYRANLSVYYDALDMMAGLELGPGTSENLDNEGYLEVAKLKDPQQMELFIRRVLSQMGLRVHDQGGLRGMIPFYDGEKSTQSFAELETELRDTAQKEDAWTTDQVSGASAPLSESGYKQVAVLNDNREMSEFVRRVISDLGLTVEDEGGLQGLSQWHSGDRAVQTYGDLQGELINASKKNVTWISKGKPCPNTGHPSEKELDAILENATRAKDGDIGDTGSELLKERSNQSDIGVPSKRRKEAGDANNKDQEDEKVSSTKLPGREKEADAKKANHTKKPDIELAKPSPAAEKNLSPSPPPGTLAPTPSPPVYVKEKAPAPAAQKNVSGSPSYVKEKEAKVAVAEAEDDATETPKQLIKENSASSNASESDEETQQVMEKDMFDHVKQTDAERAKKEVAAAASAGGNPFLESQEIGASKKSRILKSQKMGETSSSNTTRILMADAARAPNQTQRTPTGLPVADKTRASKSGEPSHLQERQASLARAASLARGRASLAASASAPARQPSARHVEAEKVAHALAQRTPVTGQSRTSPTSPRSVVAAQALAAKAPKLKPGKQTSAHQAQPTTQVTHQAQHLAMRQSRAASRAAHPPKKRRKASKHF